jgi:2-phospho-L-lactate guanylyltransferase
VIIAAVPARDFATAKQRLARVLSAGERAALARAMLEDVLAATCAAPVETVLVVTADPAVSACARAQGAAVLREVAPVGHTEAVRRAQAAAVEQGATVFLTLPGDVPCATTAEIEAVLRAVGSPRSAVLVPSMSGDGTNAVALCPPDALPLTFGEPSFANHLSAARATDLTPVVLPLPGLGLDIDTEDDLRALLARPGITRTNHLLDAWGVGARLAPGN